MTTPFGTEASRRVISELQSAGFETVFVGGAVRDFLLGKEPTDIDIATSATPEQVKKVFRHTIDIGIEHGTILVLAPEPIEVTTFRTEEIYSDHRATDEVVHGTSLKEDLQRRDFTINALAMTLEDELVDWFGGRADLEARVIRSVGKPRERFGEDPLRVLRALRFSAVLNFHIESETLEAMKQLAHELQHIAIERIKVEIDKLFQGVNPSKAFQYSREIGLPTLFPELFSSFEQLDSFVPFTHARHGWAAMLSMSEVSATELAHHFKLSNEEKRFLKQCEDALNLRASRSFDVLDMYYFPLDVLNVVERIRHAKYPDETTETYEQLVERKKQLPIQKRDELAFTGTDLLQWSGLRGGKWTSEWIEKIERAVVSGCIENDAQAIKEWFVYEISRKE
ncbi:CCA tRNA nucleotidyltransferase [Sporosarcina sp. GW1-11]|uniref:CCA tRNA nucleotidyltransferase n=1 Tax=Sporosarcina sp. GW1-11 TaxID=2899126 RepID=UPI00294FCCA1|nr:CCA tRNA nucleotidyltransferase [Sporosarcina sp. GW1-11]MDV6377695.1 CCA tRNA nucleotidyltransferase [Sporosarcina sp. GW1-11]